MSSGSWLSRTPTHTHRGADDAVAEGEVERHGRADCREVVVGRRVRVVDALPQRTELPWTRMKTVNRHDNGYRR